MHNPMRDRHYVAALKKRVDAIPEQHQSRAIRTRGVKHYLFDRNTVVERRLSAAYPVNLASPCRLAPQRHLAGIEQCELDAGRTAIESQDEVAC